jgi:hypothetical protein
MPSHSRSQKKNTEPVFVPQIQTQLQSSSWVQSAETMNPDLEVPELQMEPEPREGFGQGFGHSLGDISISAPSKSVGCQSTSCQSVRTNCIQRFVPRIDG